MLKCRGPMRSSAKRPGAAVLLVSETVLPDPISVWLELLKIYDLSRACRARKVFCETEQKSRNHARWLLKNLRLR